MNKTELIQKVVIETGLKRPQASLTVDTLFVSIQQALQNGDNVPNPITGESLIIPAKKAPAFKAGKV
ncbi:HU family DNA-binding protein [Bacillus sp. FSL R12-0069]|uniref:HU family DNA-binding protein n=1 Tax=Bacillus sp. FSL R12-0069 TaxID=2975342 RepID=UPI0030F624F8